MATIEKSVRRSNTISENESTTATLRDLHDRLDDLWRTYLQHLDRYTTSQELIQSHMSAGFISLARANFNARNGVRRYGKDFFHERATASRRAEIRSSQDNDERAQVAVVLYDGDQDLKDASDGSQFKDDRPLLENEVDRSKDQQQPSPPATPASAHEDNFREDEYEKKPRTSRSQDVDSGISDSGILGTSNSSKLNPARDPLRWFGILVPPELRSAQTSFSSVLADQVADAVNAARQMRELETDIRKLRKEIRRTEKAGSN